MFKTDINYNLRNKLAGIMPDKVEMNDEILLKAYCTFWMDAHNYKSKRYDKIQISLDMRHKDYYDVRDEFLYWDFFEFLKYALTDYICDPEKIELHFGILNDYAMLTLHILALKKVFIYKQKHSEQLKQKMYERYIKISNEFDIEPFNIKVFEEMLYAVNTFSLNQNWLAEQRMSLNEKAVKVADIYNNKLLVAKEKQYTDCAAIYRGASVNDLVSCFIGTPFCALDDGEIRQAYIEIVRNVLRADNPLSVLCALSLEKRTTSGNSPISLNDVSLENSLIYHYFMGEVASKDLNFYELIVMEPSPFFVKKMADDTVMKDAKITFIVENDDIKAIYEEHFENSNYSGQKGKNFCFTTQEEFYEKLRGETVAISTYRKTLIFVNRIKEEQKKKLWYEIISLNIISKHSIYFFGSDNDYASFMEKRTALCSSNTTDECLLVAQGIVNSSRPKQKLFWKSSSENVFPLIKMEDTRIISAKRDMQRLCLSREVKVIEDIQPLAEMGYAIRKYNRSNTARDVKACGDKKRNKPRWIRFSEEIRIWFSTTQNIAYPDKVRVEAYICEAMPEGKEERGFLARGERIEGSVKRYTRAAEDDIADWLINVYPYSVHGKSNSTNDSDIRKAVSEYYEGYYSQNEGINDISLRTLWYVYLELKDRLTQKEYSLLSEMAKSDIGELNCQFSTLEDYLNALKTVYPNDKESQLERKIGILCVALDMAVEKRHASLNALDTFVEGNDDALKKYRQVLNALIKKSFTEDEFKRIFEKICWYINHGYNEYLGLLIKLLTGLENEVVCGLTWEDFALVCVDYDVHNLLIYRQIVNDGSGYKPLRSSYQYRCIPCCSILEKYLFAYREKAKEAHPDGYMEMPIVTGKNEKREYDFACKVLPTELYSLTQKIISSLGIEDVVITIPYVGNGVKSRNLNIYGGDIFKTNLRYWSLTLGKMSLDEISYLQGKKAETTFGKHYGDFVNEDAQLLLKVKLDRIAAMLIGKMPDCLFEENVFEKQDDCEFIAEGASPLEISMLIDAKTKSTIEITNKYGFELQAVGNRR